MKVLITGVAGTGKSTISKALNEKGIFSVDFSEIPKMCFWRDSQTKEKVEYPTISPDSEWFDTHQRVCDISILKSFLDQHENVIITGVASDNQKEYFGLFDKVLLLQCSPETVRHRMQTRVPEWGKTKAAQDNVVKWQKDFEPTLLSQGAIPIDTEGDFEFTLNKVFLEI